MSRITITYWCGENPVNPRPYVSPIVPGVGDMVWLMDGYAPNRFRVMSRWYTHLPDSEGMIVNIRVVRMEDDDE